jgi:peptidylprolyl isomerase
MNWPRVLLGFLPLAVLVFGTTACGGESANTIATPTAFPTSEDTGTSSATTPTVGPTAAPQGNSSRAEIGDTVAVHYTGSLANGTVFDSSAGRDPLQFVLGRGQLIRGFEQATLGMSTGESKTVVIPAEEAYGPHLPQLVLTKSWSELPPDWGPEAGDQLPLTQADGSVIWATVTEVTEAGVTLDANHRLAGKDLTFEIELVEITKS